MTGNSNVKIERERVCDKHFYHCLVLIVVGALVSLQPIIITYTFIHYTCHCFGLSGIRLILFSYYSACLNFVR